MDVIEIIKESLVYPADNFMALLIYVILGIIATLAVVLTIGGVYVGSQLKNVLVAGVSGIVGIVVAIIISFLIEGYMLDVLKLAIQRSNDSPKIDFVRQVTNGLKLFIVDVVYLIIPAIVLIILGAIFAQWLALLIGLIVTIIFGFILVIAECRLAYTENLSDALAVGEAYNDLQRVGIMNIIQLTVIFAVIYFVVLLITGGISQLNAYIGSVLSAIATIYLLFVQKRAVGLLYSQ